jgi:hypothetical protein
MRANYNIETTEDNKSRNQLTSVFFIFGVPHGQGGYIIELNHF